MNKATKNILLFLLLMAALPVCAQNMRVAGFRHIENEFTAKAGSKDSEKDGNGDLAALVKVVVPIEGFNFSGGDLYGIVKVLPKAGEYWVYVPNQTLSLIISHARFTPLNYSFPAAVKGGETYEMLIDPGNGQYVTLQGSRPGAELILDDNFVGKGPTLNYYLLAGTHTLRATAGKWEGMQSFEVTVGGDVSAAQRVVTVPMTDQSAYYGQGRVTVDNEAEIYYAGKQVGIGVWDFDLREGTYEVETRKENSDPARTTITVKPGSEGNDAKLKAPTPHTGWLNLYTRPRNVTATNDGKPIDLREPQLLPVGTHQISISRKGYVSKNNLEYVIRNKEVTRDTIQLERITYVKPLAFYFGVGYTLRSLAGITGTLGAVLKGHDLQVGYTFGATASDIVHWYGSDASSAYLSAITYKMNSLSVKYGYQFNLMRQLAITPQLGYSLDQLSGTVERGTNLYGDGAKAHCMTLGVKLLLVPVQHVYLFAAPEFGVALKKGPNYDTIAEVSNVQAGGFAATLGVLVNF